MAEILRFGDAPNTSGGDFERECVAYLGEHLPADCTVIAHLPLPTIHSNVYDNDIIVAGPWGHEILECKKVRPEVTVGENFLRGVDGFTIDSVFTPLQNKCRALVGRLQDQPFRHPPNARVFGRVIVPSDADVRFLHADHEANRKVMTLQEATRELTRQATPFRGTSVTSLWRQYRASYQAPGEFRSGYLGRFLVRKRLPSQAPTVEYLAVDEPPCKADVHLLELPFPSRLNKRELHDYLAQAAHAMAALRRLRHPLIQCVIGHFYTGDSLVQVSDWFDGRALEDFLVTENLSLDDKLQLMTRVCDALIYCHEQNVFHRNIHPRNVLIGDCCGDVQLTGFECVKDSRQDRTAPASEMKRRDRRIVPPEELGECPVDNYRLYDIFQAGVLFYWIAEDGRWPFASTHEYKTGDARLQFSHDDDPRYAGLHEMISGMLSLSPQHRPNVMQRVLDSLQAIA